LEIDIFQTPLAGPHQEWARNVVTRRPTTKKRLTRKPIFVGQLMKG
jgi:hypothetical protein